MAPSHENWWGYIPPPKPKPRVVESYSDVLEARIVKLVIERRLIRANKDKVFKDSLEELYYDTYREHLNFEAMGFQDVFHFCKHISHETPLSCEHMNYYDTVKPAKYYLVFNEKLYGQWIDETKRKRQFQSIVELTGLSPQEDDITADNYKSYTPYFFDFKKFPRGEDERHWIRIVHFTTPQLFVFHLDFMQDELKRLRLDLIKTYNADQLDDDKYSIPYELLMKEMLVVARNPEEHWRWDRCIIVDWVSWEDRYDTDEELVKLYSIDYGNLFTTDRSNIRYMKIRLVKDYPAFACYGSLGEKVQSREGNKWTDAVREYFYKYYIKKVVTLQCEFIRIVPQTPLTEVKLRHKDSHRDKKGHTKDFFLHNALVEDKISHSIPNRFEPIPLVPPNKPKFESKYTRKDIMQKYEKIDKENMDLFKNPQKAKEELDKLNSNLLFLSDEMISYFTEDSEEMTEKECDTPEVIRVWREFEKKISL